MFTLRDVERIKTLAQLKNDRAEGRIVKFLNSKLKEHNQSIIDDNIYAIDLMQNTVFNAYLSKFVKSNEDFLEAKQEAYSGAIEYALAGCTLKECLKEGCLRASRWWHKEYKQKPAYRLEEDNYE